MILIGLNQEQTYKVVVYVRKQMMEESYGIKRDKYNFTL